MDGHTVDLNDSFQYVADPTFENFTDGVKKQVNKLIHAKVNGLNEQILSSRLCLTSLFLYMEVCFLFVSSA